jgi:hypothetical protein
VEGSTCGLISGYFSGIPRGPSVRTVKVTAKHITDSMERSPSWEAELEKKFPVFMKLKHST